MKKFGPSGFTLVEIMVGAALLGALSLGVMQLTKSMQKGQKTVELKGQKSDVMTTLKLYLSNKSSCEETLRGIVAGPTIADSTPVTKIIRGGTVPAPVVDLGANLGVEYGEGAAKIKIDSMMLSKYEETKAPTPTVPGEGTAVLLFNFRKNSNSKDGTYGPDTYTEKIPLQLYVDNTHKVVACMDREGASTAACEMFGGEIAMDATTGEIVCQKLKLVQPDSSNGLTLFNQATKANFLLGPDQMSFSDPTKGTALHIRSWGSASDIETIGGPLVLNNKTVNQKVWKKDVADADGDGDVDELIETNEPNDGHVQIGGYDPADTNTLMVAGTIYAQGDITSAGNVHGIVFIPSDERFKKNISTIENASDRLAKIRGVTFEWEKNQKPDSGFIAQEIKEVFPHLVTERSDGYFGVNYNGIIPYLVEAIKQDHQTITRLEKRIEALEKLLKKENH